MVATLALAGCKAERGADNGPRADDERPAGQGGRIVDLAGTLKPAEEAALARRLAAQQQADGRPVMVVVIDPGREQSLEQVGWAIGGGQGAARPLLLLVDPASGRVRIEGDLQPPAKAAVAASMQPDLAAGRVAAAIDRGLLMLERSAP
jgi:uncharacterized membrane protein YgcG